MTLQIVINSIHSFSLWPEMRVQFFHSIHPFHLLHSHHKLANPSYLWMVKRQMPRSQHVGSSSCCHVVQWLYANCANYIWYRCLRGRHVSSRWFSTVEYGRPSFSSQVSPIIVQLTWLNPYLNIGVFELLTWRNLDSSWRNKNRV